MRDTIERWIAQDPDPQTRQELANLVENEDWPELESRFSGRLSFGTAGLRAIMGAGPTRMNSLVIRQTTAGLATYLLEQIPFAIEQGVVVGFDGRHNSKRFATEAACVLAALGIQVHLAKEPLPTPVCAYAMGTFGAACGIVVTASHNPPAYNGFKVYWTNGAQIIPPHDQGIAQAIAGASEVPIPWMDFQAAKQIGLITYFGPRVVSKYICDILMLTTSPTSPSLSTLRIAYTPLHGVGAAITERALRTAGFANVATVASQREPDGDFPTVAFPNPEEPGAMDAVLELAKSTQADLAYANDPDADRLAVAVRRPDGEYQKLTGDEIGVVLAAELINAYPQGSVVGSTVVSSRLLRRIAIAHDVDYFETLTGFKWIANAAMKAERAGKRFLLGYEEAIGYSIGSLVRDKDGISAVLGFSQLCARLCDQDTTVLAFLEAIYRRHGLVLTAQHSLALDPNADAEPIGDMLRKSPPISIAGRKITRTHDLTQTPELYSTEGPVPIDPTDVIIYYLEDDTRVIIRPSGTEPKVKCYYEIIDAIGDDESFDQAQGRAKEILADIIATHQQELSEMTS